MLNLYAQFAAVEASDLGTAIKASSWLFPAIEAAHLLALALLGGSLLILDLRLLGAGLTLQPTSVVERESRPWLISALATMIVSGVLIGCSEALKLYDKPAFWVKMGALAAAALFTFAVKLPLARRDVSGSRAKSLAVLSLGLWLAVALAGRWIGFS
ncbi:MAG TPA: DUF6644 family protein [Rhizomicrobium sp.]